MNNLDGFNSNGITLGIKENNDNTILLRIYNNSDTNIITALTGSRYISISNGILGLSDTYPSDMKYSSIGQTIISDSFMNIQMNFNNSIINNNDRIELQLKNIGVIIVKRENQNWKIIENNSNQQLVELLNSKIEHLEAIEEKIGISLQNLSIAIESDNTLKLYCEVLSLSNNGPSSSFSIEVGIYDKNNKIIDFRSITKDKDDFLGFEIFSFGTISIEKPLREIGRIVFYPVKI